MVQPVSGQRWVSKTEANLGLGVVLKAEYGRVEIFFPAANELRQYAVKSAPLRRVRFQAGDAIRTHAGESFVVTEVTEHHGLLVYRCGDAELPESELADTISFSKPEDRLLAGQIDDLRAWRLRAEALKWRSDMQRSGVRGFVGGRVDLLPHQMYIASEVAGRVTPRVLLADEVGLGKTIEAGLIAHRMHLTGRADRVLVLVPEALVHQWFVELLRRFNLLASIFDEPHCEAVLSDDEDANPFLASQIVLCSIDFLARNEARARQCIDARWDLLIVDEAHHLEWSPDGASPSYRLVEALAAGTPGLLLLTATPEQLGPEGHFARLRLLDPERYDRIDWFREEAEHYADTAAAVDRLLAGQSLAGEDEKVFARKSERVGRLVQRLGDGGDEVRQELIACLLDEFGTGRVMFRNTRAALKGFPERRAVLAPLDADPDAAEAKVKWLAGLLKELGEAKVLLICRTRELAEETQERLLREINVSSGLFHEDMTLVQRDRAAVHFADEDGARILLCSEIGSEGRNFQFAHHLVLFDLPDNPELLEQRIGRLDRIGQTATIQIHVPYVKGTAGEVLARWYHEGLNAFEKHPHGAPQLHAEFRDELAALCVECDPAGVDDLIARTAAECGRIARKMERGHDRLLELNSFKPEGAERVIHQIRELDEDPDFEDFVARLMDRLGMEVEEHDNRSYVIRPGSLAADALPLVPADGLLVTFDRARALSRDNIGFLTIDHPAVRGALDLLLGGELGNTAFGVWKNSGEEGILVDLHYVVECAAPAALHVNRFLPMMPVRVIVDHALKDHSDDEDMQTAGLSRGDPSRLIDSTAFRKKLMPAMLKRAAAIASERMATLVESSLREMTHQLDTEIERLEDLARINHHVRPEEVAALRQAQLDLAAAIASAALRLDSVRLVMRVK